MLHHSQVIANY